MAKDEDRALTDEEEFTGWALYPSGSYFNHACQPNVNKLRNGRTWYFRASATISPAEEATISYLGGEEKTLDVHERRARLLNEWGFWCECIRCKIEAAEREDASKASTEIEQ